MYNHRIFSLSIIAIVFLALPNLSAAKTKLSPAEVQQVFIGTPWNGPNGVFLFRKDGTYTYQKFGSGKPLGTWSYKMRTDGKIDGETTSYTFYRRSNGKFQYHHSKSGKFYKAVPNKKAPFE